MSAIPAALAGDLDKLVTFNIQAQNLDKALLKFGAQAHVQLSFAPDYTTAGLRTQQLKGTYTAKSALARLLKGTRLRYVVVSQHTIEIIPVASSTEFPRSSSSSQVQPVRDEKVSDHVGDPDDQPAESSKTPRHLQEVVVTGSRLPASSNEGPQEVQIYDRENIDQSGQTSISDFVNTLPSMSVTTPQTAQGLATTVTLRGLPVGSTLILIDGRRLEDSGSSQLISGANYFDLNNLPLAAVERIEVDESGSSAIYGSDAIGGIVNIILRKDFAGFALNAKYGWEKDTSTTRFDLVWGKQWDRGGLSIIGSFGIDGGLLNTQRLLTSSNDYTSSGGPDGNFDVCSPGNVFSASGAPLPGAPVGSGATFAGIAGSTKSGAPALSQFMYGVLNQCSLLQGEAILPSAHRAATIADGHLDLTPSVELFSELIYTHETLHDAAGYQFLFGNSVPPANPYNPFGETVTVNEWLTEVPRSSEYDMDFFRPLVGIKGTLADRWQWEVSAWQSTDWTQETDHNFFQNGDAIQNALNSSDPASALNPFIVGPAAPQSVLDSLSISGAEKSMGRDREAEAFIRGPILHLPAGDIQAVVGGDYVKSALDLNYIYNISYQPNTRQNYHRSYNAGFAQARIPLIRHPRSRRSEALLALTVAGRHDQYSDFGGRTTGEFGVEFRPLDGLLVRGSYADAFEAPSLPDLHGAQGEAPTQINDPLTGTTVIAQLVSGGNPNLLPMTGISRSIGLVYSNPAMPGLAISITHWLVRENNSIQVMLPQVIVDNADAFAGRVIRNSAGDIDEVNDSEVNFGSINIAGIDYQVEYGRLLGQGTISVVLNASQTYRYIEALTPGAPAVEAVSTAQDDGDWAPRWKGTVGMGWKSSWVSAYVDGRYTGSYQDYDSTRLIGNFWILDANLRLDLGRRLIPESGWLKGAYVELGATNLSNRAPQFSNYEFDEVGYDAAEMNILGRVLYVGVGMGW
ncbi:MAG: TonB-dependent receptor domain-containing protein [Steroidobacteraceae bacterium]